MKFFHFLIIFLIATVKENNKLYPYKVDLYYFYPIFQVIPIKEKVKCRFYII